MNSVKYKRIKRNIIKCNKCSDIIESKSTHDFVTCKCGKCSVDGGLSYLRRCGNSDNWTDLSIVEEIEIIPKYERGDHVKFRYLLDILIGTIVIVDINTYDGSIEYDVLDNKGTIRKHVNEKDILKIG